MAGGHWAVGEACRGEEGWIGSEGVCVVGAWFHEARYGGAYVGVGVCVKRPYWNLEGIVRTVIQRTFCHTTWTNCRGLCARQPSNVQHARTCILYYTHREKSYLTQTHLYVLGKQLTRTRKLHKTWTDTALVRTTINGSVKAFKTDSLNPFHCI